MASVDASNSCIPQVSPLEALSPPLPTTVRGEPCVLDGRPGRLNADRSVILYGSGRLVIVRDLEDDVGSSSSSSSSNGNGNDTGNDDNDDDATPMKQAFVYRGHMATVTCAKFSPSGCYVASADARGKLRVWSYDNEEHLCKLDLNVMTGPIRDISWDTESKRLCLAGERSDTSSACVRVIQWDTGVTCGELGQHTRGRAASCSFKPNRPMRIASGGKDDSKCYFNAGPPFKRVVDGTPTDNVHVKGAVNCLRFSSDGTKIISAGTDKTVALYDGKTMTLSAKLENVHTGTIYACAWNSNDSFVLTCSADGTAKLIAVGDASLEVVHTWNVAALLVGATLDSVPIGGMVVGCAFIKDDIPVVVSINSELSLLPKPPMLSTGLDEYKKLTGHVAPIAGMAVDYARGLLYTADTDGTLCQYSLDTGKAVKRFSPPGLTDLLGKMHGEATISCLTALADGSVLTAGWDDAVRMVASNGSIVEKAIALDAQPNAMSSGAELSVVVTVGGLVVIKDGAAVSSMIALPYSALSVCVSADDKTIYVGGNDCKIHIYSVTGSCDLEEKHIIESAHLKPIHALALSNDQSKLASADVRDVCVWNVSENYAQIIGKSRWCFHTQRITCLTWSPDDSILASGGADDSIYLWSLAKKTKRLHYPFSHRGGVTGLAFLRLGLKLVSVGADSCVNQWNVEADVVKKFS